MVDVVGYMVYRDHQGYVGRECDLLEVVTVSTANISPSVQLTMGLYTVNRLRSGRCQLSRDVRLYNPYKKIAKSSSYC